MKPISLLFSNVKGLKNYEIDEIQACLFTWAQKVEIFNIFGIEFDDEWEHSTRILFFFLLSTIFFNRIISFF